VFSNDLDRVRYPLAARLWGVFLGTLVMSAIMLAYVSPRTLPFTYGVLFVGVVYAAATRKPLAQLLPRSYDGLSVFVFLAYAASSALWAAHPHAPLIRAALAAVCLSASAFMVRSFLEEPRRNTFHIAEGLWLGVIAGLAYLLVEFLTHQTIKIHLYNAIGVKPEALRPPAFFIWAGNKLVSISPDDLTRNIAPVSLMIWPALLAVRQLHRPLAIKIVSVLLLALALAVVFKSEHETSKGAILGGLLVFAVAHLSYKWSDRLLRLSWIVGCLAMIPLALLLHRLDLQHASWVQPTMQHRIVIWNYTAEQTLKAPIRGIGAGMMYELYGPARETPGDNLGFETRMPHAHNVYLQTWHELGVIGAALLALAGLAVLERIRRLGPSLAPYGQATFASGALVGASSYGMWQEWFIALYGFTAVLLAIAVRSQIDKERTPGLPGALH
jgi:O-antigen ligase